METAHRQGHEEKDWLAAAGISQSSLSKMSGNENVNTDILVKV